MDRKAPRTREHRTLRQGDNPPAPIWHVTRPTPSSARPERYRTATYVTGRSLRRGRPSSCPIGPKRPESSPASASGDGLAGVATVGRTSGSVDLGPSLSASRHYVEPTQPGWESGSARVVALAGGHPNLREQVQLPGGSAKLGPPRLPWSSP